MSNEIKENTMLSTKSHTTNTKMKVKHELPWASALCSNQSLSVSGGRSDRRSLIETLLLRSGNVESNPGPADGNDGHGGQRKMDTALSVISYNVRGLKDESKLSHLLSCLYKKMGGKNKDFVACLQETYLDKEGRLPYLWRGNYHLTPGAGNSCGCVTLVSPHINIIGKKNIGNRAHVLACQKVGANGTSYIVANIYAPCPNSNEKAEFFEELFDVISDFEERYNCSRSLIVGDFNLNLHEKEMKNRLYTAQEKRIANQVKNLAINLNLADCWQLAPEFTWRRPNSNVFSTIDRILFSKSELIMTECKSNWSLSFSDHAAIEASFNLVDSTQLPRSRIIRLDPMLAKDPVAKVEITEGVERMMANVPGHWDPHMKLEFLKVAIRTVVEKVQADRNRKEKNEEDLLNEELEVAISELGKGRAALGQQPLIDYIEDLRVRKSIIVEEKGKRLAERLGTKWYNEGEKSNRYFMRLLNRANPDKFTKILDRSG